MSFLPSKTSPFSPSTVISFHLSIIPWPYVSLHKQAAKFPWYDGGMACKPPPQISYDRSRAFIPDHIGVVMRQQEYHRLWLYLVHLRPRQASPRHKQDPVRRQAPQDSGCCDFFLGFFLLDRCDRSDWRMNISLFFIAHSISCGIPYRSSSIPELQRVLKFRYHQTFAFFYLMARKINGLPVLWSFGMLISCGDFRSFMVLVFLSTR